MIFSNNHRAIRFWKSRQSHVRFRPFIPLTAPTEILKSLIQNFGGLNECLVLQKTSPEHSRSSFRWHELIIVKPELEGTHFFTIHFESAANVGQGKVGYFTDEANGYMQLIGASPSQFFLLVLEGTKPLNLLTNGSIWQGS